MVFEDYNIDGNKITISKKELEEAKKHYEKIADKFKPKKKDKAVDPRYTLYLGKADMLHDILKMFEPIDFM